MASGNPNEDQRRPKRARRNYKEITKAQAGRTLDRKVGRGKTIDKRSAAELQHRLGFILGTGLLVSM